MDVFSVFVKFLSFPLISRRHGLRNIYQHVKMLEESQYWTQEHLNELQLKRLKKLLVHAYENTDFYKKRFDDSGFNPYNFRYHDDLIKLPYLTKNEIRNYASGLTARNYHASQLHSSETGGTTGVKMVFYRDNDCLPLKEAALYRFDKWAGWDFGKRMGLVWPAQQDYVGHWTLKAKLKNMLYTRQVVLPGAIIDDAMLKGFIKELREKRPVMIRAFPNPLYEVAQYIKNNNIKDVSTNGVITTGEPLYAWQRKLISNSFHCDIFDSYRSREAGPIAQECECHEGMHVNAESLYIEIMDGVTSPDMHETTGEIVITDLLNFGMPFIRYRMGDIGTISSSSCSCGRGLPLMKKIEGRTGDNLFTSDMKTISPGALVLYLVDEAPGLIGQIQIIQDRLDHIHILMTNDPPPSGDVKEYQVKTIKRLFGESTQVSFETVDKIPREKSGKYSYVKCMLGMEGLTVSRR